MVAIDAIFFPSYHIKKPPEAKRTTPVDLMKTHLSTQRAYPKRGTYTHCFLRNNTTAPRANKSLFPRRKCVEGGGNLYPGGEIEGGSVAVISEFVHTCGWIARNSFDDEVIAATHHLGSAYLNKRCLWILRCVNSDASGSSRKERSNL